MAKKTHDIYRAFLTEKEADEIITYTGLDIVLELPVWQAFPVVHFSRNSSNNIDFITIVKKNAVMSGCT